MATAAAATKELRDKISEYGAFISRVLQPQLQSAVDARDEAEAEIAEYATLQGKLRELEGSIASNKKLGDEPLQAIVDVAHGAVYCDVEIPNPRTIYVNVGFGFHVEMTLSEAIAFIDKRIDYLEKNVLEHRAEAAARVAKDVEDALELLRELGEELGELEGK